jgi:hypothetical protein
MHRLVSALFIFCCLAVLGPQHLAAARLPAPAPVEMGIDRSNMATEWTLSPPAEPKIYPFTGPYNGAGVFEARRTAVFDGAAELHVSWFRDGFGGDTAKDAQLFVDTVSALHARGLKVLAVVGPTGSDFDPKDRIAGNPSVNGCRWGTAPLSKIDLTKFAHRLRAHFVALKQAGLTVDAFEIGNELDLYCNDADMPMTSEFAKHHWKWFLTADQVRAFDAGYVPFLTTFAGLIREYFPQAKIITFGMSNPTGDSAALIAGLAHFTDSTGRTFDYTTLVDGYGTHIYPKSDTTEEMVATTTRNLTDQAAELPHSDEKPLWITEWNPSDSAFWSTHKWYFQFDASGVPGGDLNLARSPYEAMDRAEAIRTFETDVVDRLRAQAEPVNIGYVFYYAYDSVGKTTMCDQTTFDKSRNIQGLCYSGVIDPVTGDLLPDVASAVSTP